MSPLWSYAPRTIHDDITRRSASSLV